MQTYPTPPLRPGMRLTPTSSDVKGMPPMAYVPSVRLLQYLEPFLDRYKEVEGELEELRREHARIAKGWAAFLTKPNVSGVIQAREFYALCMDASSDILISAPDLIFCQTLSPQTVDMDMESARQKIAIMRAEPSPFIPTRDDARRSSRRKAIWVSVIIVIAMVGAAALLKDLMGGAW